MVKERGHSMKDKYDLVTQPTTWGVEAVEGRHEAIHVAGVAVALSHQTLDERA